MRVLWEVVVVVTCMARGQHQPYGPEDKGLKPHYALAQLATLITLRPGVVPPRQA